MSVASRLMIACSCVPLGAPAMAQQVVHPPGPATPVLLTAPARPGVPATSSAGAESLGLGALPQGPMVLPQADTTPQAAPLPAPAPISAQEGVAAPGTQGSAPPPGTEDAPSKPAARIRKAPHDNGRTQHALFERLPIHVLLAPDAERLVRFPFVALMDLPPGLEGLLEVQIIEDTAYLTANAPFPRARVHVQAIDGTTKIPLDIEAAEGVAVAPMLQVHLPGDGDADDDASTGSQEAPTVDMIELTRYAAQTLYAPSRLVPVLPGVHQEPVDRKTVSGLYRGAEIETAPLGAWSSGPLHVTAVRFTNRSDRPLELDVEQLRGRWIAATPQHWRLLPRGSEADTTAVYLVSDRPFAAVPLWR